MAAFNSPLVKRGALGVVLVLACAGTWLGWHLSHATATPPAAAPAAPAPPAPAPVAPAGADTSAIPTTSRIEFSTVPPANATVTWGKTLLGRIAPHASLVVVRPRDSGPLDVTVRAPGYLPVHTRAHTFADTTVAVKLTRPDQESTLFGYRAPLDAGTPGEEPAPPGSGAPDLQQPPQ